MKKTLSALRAILGMAVFALLLAPVIGLPLWVELGNQAAPGEVIDKREEITVRRATWSRRLFLDVRYQPADTGVPEQTAISVDPELYDRMRVGAQTTVHYLPRPDLRWLGALAGARLEGQPPFGQLRAMVGRGVAWIVGIGVWLVVLLIWSRWRRWWLALALLLAMAGAAVYAVSDWPLPAPPGPQLQADATVRDTHLIDRVIWRSRARRNSLDNRAAQPYVVVELSFTPQGAADPVVAVDLVDEGSVQGLEQGATLPIRYSATDPRWAQIEGAQRTYAITALIILALIVGVWAFSRIRRRRRAPDALP
jgi:hypothetical protein